MSPALQEGDWVFVDENRAIEFGDVVVFREPESGVVVVKRVCGLPGETIQLLDGRLLVDGEPTELPPTTVREQVPMFAAVGGEALQAFREFRFFSMDGFLQKGLYVEGIYPAMGMGIEVDLVLPEPESVAKLEVRAGEDIFQLVFDAAQETVSLRRVAPGETVFLVKAEWPARLHGGKVRGTAFLSLQGQRIHGTWNDELLFPPASFTPSPQRVLADAPIEFGRSGQPGLRLESGAEVGGVRVGRAISRIARGTFGCVSPLVLSKEEYYLLGDNPSQSRDSRQYGAIPREQMLGVVRAHFYGSGRNEWGWPE